MNIIIKSGDMDMATLYRLTKSPEIAKLTTVKGQELDLDKFIVYEDSSTDGVITTVAAFETTAGELFATNSPTFTRDFLDILAMCKEAGAPYPKKIKVLPKIGKSGREYIQCVYIA
jgi:hypothetical protein